MKDNKKKLRINYDNSLNKRVTLINTILNDEKIFNDIYDIIFQIKKKLSNNKIIFIGNGGSAAEAQHAAAEYVSKFKKNRSALPALSLTTDTSILTSISNDFDYKYIFSRQLEAISKKGDILFVMSTSGKSKNIIEAIKNSKKYGLYSILITGKINKHSSSLRPFLDKLINIPSNNTAKIQEISLFINHFICEQIENYSFR